MLAGIDIVMAHKHKYGRTTYKKLSRAAFFTQLHKALRGYTKAKFYLLYRKSLCNTFVEIVFIADLPEFIQYNSQ